MKTLTIKDLGHTEALDHRSMAAVRGGTSMSLPCYPSSMQYPSPKTDSLKIDQSLTQLQDVQNFTANGSAFLSGVTANNCTEQFGQNNVAVL
jgi:hypothetical protein